MSYYKDFCSPSEKGETHAFLVLMNSHGEMVVHRLDQDGKSTGFACGDTVAMFRTMLQEQYPNARIVREDAEREPWEFVSATWRSKPETFAEIAALLNCKKSSVGRAVAQYAVYRLGWARLYIEWEPKHERWEPTKKAKELDKAKNSP